MFLSRGSKYTRRLSGALLVLLIVLLGCSACASSTSAVPSAQVAKGPLPGQQIWKQGASSFLFGTNDTYEWSPKNLQTQPAIQQQLRAAGLTLVRSFFPDLASDAALDSRARTIENIGASCLGVIPNIFHTAFDEHLVRYLGNRCQMYEFGNESDYNGISIERYLVQWNALIPALRRINPQARFIGPVTYTELGDHTYMKAFLTGVKASGVLPDAVSFHLYPCGQDTAASCLSKASSFGQAAEQVRALVQSILGKDLPVGISEWNYDPGNPPAAYGDDPTFMTKFTTSALLSMVQAGVSFACQFDAASYSGYGHLDMFNVATGQAKAQYYALKQQIQAYRPSPVAATPVAAAPTTGSPSHSASELVSRGKPVYCSENNQGAGGPPALVDGHYGNWKFWSVSSATLPSWCAIHVGAGPARLLLVWASDYVFDYITDTGLSPRDYSLAVSADSTNGADGTWRTVTTVAGNLTRVREHLLPFAGSSWVKMTVTHGQVHASQPYIFIDEIDLYDVSQNLNDTFFFSGDSITGEAYSRSDERQPSFAEDVHASDPRRFPAMLDGGLGGWNTDGAAQYIDTWLALNPDIHYWLLGWGTNDALEQVAPAHFRANLQVLIDKIKLAGHIPLLAHIPAVRLPGARGTSVNQEIQQLNMMIDQATTANKLLPGPDLYRLFLTHINAYLISDGIHPTPAGAVAMNRAWFEVVGSLHS
ncbi:MAG: GDSL-type esterase/lipase family protein [Ktedonobacteraceae bacterium]